VTRAAAKKVATKERECLRECLPGEVVVLARETPFGGWMYGRSFPGGTRVMVSWHALRSGHPSTFVVALDEGWAHDPVPCEPNARVSEVLVSRIAGEDSSGASDDDPLTRRIRGPLFNL
jgi:hypothetical protein